MPIGFFLIGKNTTVIVILIALIIATYIDLSRLFNLPGWHLLEKPFRGMIRDHENNTMSGAFYILLAGLLAGILFETSHAAAVMGFVVLGDIAAALTGRKFGKIRLPGTNKTLEGSIGCLLACMIVAFVVPGLPLFVGIAGALTASIAEAFSGKIDDNIAMVIASGIVMYLIS
jgi:dolichol kinase